MPESSWLIIRGVVGIVVGLTAFAWPAITLAVLISVFAIYALADGITNLFLGFSRRGAVWSHILQGVMGVGAGVLTFIWPGLTMFVLIMFIGAWAVVTGALEIAAAIRLRKEITGEWLMMLSGALSVIFGLMVFAFPGAGAVGISWVLAAYALAAGITLVVLGIRLRSHGIGLSRPAHV